MELSGQQRRQFIYATVRLSSILENKDWARVRAIHSKEQFVVINGVVRVCLIEIVILHKNLRWKGVRQVDFFPLLGSENSHRKGRKCAWHFLKL